MQNVSAAPDMKIGWPWQPEDVAPDRDDESAFPAPWWHRVNPSMLIIWVVGVILCLVLMNVTAQAIYRHQLDVQGQWIAQRSQAEVTCLSRAHDAAARTVCARNLASAVTQQEATFDHFSVAMGYGNAAAQMHSAFDALYGAACYNSDGQTADDTCLQRMAPSLRHLASLDAVAAEHS
jgi:hypothetical protein